jgi:hypothetical protein
MCTDRFFQNQDYSEYIRLLFDLHRAISEGWDETESGEMLRERMDEPGSRLSRDEIDSVSRIAADFYSLTDAPSYSCSPLTAVQLADLQPVFQHQNLTEIHIALELLRNHGGSIPPASLAYLRGKIWMEAREYRIAAAFLERATELDPNNANFRYMALHALWIADPPAGTRMAEVILAKWQRHPPRLVLKALDVQLQFIRAKSNGHTRRELESFVPMFEDSIIRFETSGEEEVEGDPNLLRRSFSHLDYCQHG